MSGAKVRVETRPLPSGDDRQISHRRHGSTSLSERETELQAAVQSVLSNMVRAVEAVPASTLRVGELQVEFNIAFLEGEGTFLCSSPAEGTFAVKLSLMLAEPASGQGPAGETPARSSAD